jgi:hypothetical protein
MEVNNKYGKTKPIHKEERARQEGKQNTFEWNKIQRALEISAKSWVNRSIRDLVRWLDCCPRHQLGKRWTCWIPGYDINTGQVLNGLVLSGVVVCHYTIFTKECHASDRKIQHGGKRPQHFGHSFKYYIVGVPERLWTFMPALQIAQYFSKTFFNPHPHFVDHGARQSVYHGAGPSQIQWPTSHCEEQGNWLPWHIGRCVPDRVRMGWRTRATDVMDAVRWRRGHS